VKDGSHCPAPQIVYRYELIFLASDLRFLLAATTTTTAAADTPHLSSFCNITHHDSIDYFLHHPSTARA